VSRVLCLAFVCLTSVSQLNAAFKDIGWSVRAVGMGGAFVGVCDDATGILYNPAGIAQVEYYETNFMHTKLYTGLDTVDLTLNYVAFMLPKSDLGFGSLGLNWANFSAAQYREDIINFVYAESINKIVKQLFNYRLRDKLLVGLNIKYLQHSYSLDVRTVNDPVFAGGNSKSNITMDIGLLYKPIPRRFRGFSAGVVVKNITQPDVGLKNQDMVPLEIGIGAAFKIDEFGSIKNILSAVDFTYRNQDWSNVEDKLNIHLGAEAWFINEILGLRLGGNYNELSFGFSIKPKIKSRLLLQFDYALLWPLQIQETTGTHKFSLSVFYK